MSLKRLPPSSSFPVDTRPPPVDQIALKYARKWFGDGPVDKAIGSKHRAVASNEAIMDNIRGFDRRYAPRITDPVWESILQRVYEEIKPNELIIPYTTGGALKDPDFPMKKSPGLPWKLEGYGTKGDVCAIPENINKIKEPWYKVGRGYHTSMPDCMVYYRSHICDTEENKIRAVWGYPLEVFTEEARFVYPFLQHLKTTPEDYPIAYGLEMINGGMAYLEEAWQQTRAKFAIMLDWSSFDQSIPPWLIRDAFSILERCFDFSHVLASDGKIFPVDPDKTHRRWKRLISYFINTPFRMPTGERFLKSGGVPSGSGFTNLIDSIVNILVVRYITYHNLGELPLHDMALGDDSVVYTNGHPSLERMSELAQEWFGMTINMRKSYVTRCARNIQFLGYYNEYGMPFRDVQFLIASWIFPERFQTPDPAFTAIRGLGQLWSTMNSTAAVFWHYAVSDIISDYNLPSNWIEDIREKYPNVLKFLSLYGITKISLPEIDARASVFEVTPRIKPLRYPKRRDLDIRSCYQRGRDVVPLRD
ncbi:RdRp [Beihai partiti-like virus 2]|uniref:RdRp n=1 Tax=Beihai partiti-like virus 2 TaxID=1922504 RepID=UPI00090A901B|nr:RdRp [Beihai partiti-like virus 2]APG78196.1 RdRp [Beihai partiti-like virus 2]